jgi:hypothetical protein
MGKNLDPDGSRMNIRELRNNVSVKKYEFFDADPDPGSFRAWIRYWYGKIQIRDPE